MSEQELGSLQSLVDLIRENPEQVNVVQLSNPETIAVFDQFQVLLDEEKQKLKEKIHSQVNIIITNGGPTELDFVSLFSRLESFSAFPYRGNGERLAILGFYLLASYHLKCFYCGVEIKQREIKCNENLHKLYSDKCAYYHLNSVSTISTVEPNEENQCKICLSAPLEIVFLPCCHYGTCKSCSTSFTQCPFCKISVIGLLRIFKP